MLNTLLLLIYIDEILTGNNFYGRFSLIYGATLSIKFQEKTSISFESNIMHFVIYKATRGDNIVFNFFML